MFTSFEYEAITKSKQKDLECALESGMSAWEAKNGQRSNGRRMSKMLVKLASLLIRWGEYLQSHAERDIKRTFPGASLQNS